MHQFYAETLQSSLGSSSSQMVSKTVEMFACNNAGPGWLVGSISRLVTDNGSNTQFKSRVGAEQRVRGQNYIQQIQDRKIQDKVQQSESKKASQDQQTTKSKS